MKKHWECFVLLQIVGLDISTLNKTHLFTTRSLANSHSSSGSTTITFPRSYIKPSFSSFCPTIRKSVSKGFPTWDVLPATVYVRVLSLCFVSSSRDFMQEASG